MIQQKIIKNSNNFLDKLENDTTHNNTMKAQVVKLILNFTYLKKANRKEKNINLTMIANMKKIQMITQTVATQKVKKVVTRIMITMMKIMILAQAIKKINNKLNKKPKTMELIHT